MNFLPEVCPKPRNKRLDFGDDLDCDPDLTDLHETFIIGMSLAKEKKHLNCGNDPDYDRDLD